MYCTCHVSHQHVYYHIYHNPIYAKKSVNCLYIHSAVILFTIAKPQPPLR
jgi:hypothetical protein